jgi:hypothetical protein
MLRLKKIIFDLQVNNLIFIGSTVFIDFNHNLVMLVKLLLL